MCLYVRGKEQKRLEKEDYIQQLGKPKYKVGEEVCFVYGKDRDQEGQDLYNRRLWNMGTARRGFV